MQQLKGIITDIQRFSVHDGPGIRTTVFMKGCSNNCLWCHNPETINLSPQLEFYPDRCIGCGKCFELCPEKAHLKQEGHKIDRERCIVCGKCADNCYATALDITGEKITVEDLLERVMFDEAYYNSSGGGVTLSGGEPVLQNEFCLEILKKLKEKDIHTTIQTAGNYDLEKLKPLLPFLDLIMYDFKAWSQDIFSKYIKGNRELIISNLKELDNYNLPIIVRTPVIGSVNDTVFEIESIAKWLGGLNNLKYYVLIPYHKLGKMKYEALGKENNNEFYTPDRERMLELSHIAAEYIKVHDQKKGFI
ncbi:MAG: glycyl-radical enzyme activating protein [bacterium]